MRYNRLRLSKFKNNNFVVVFALLFITSSTLLRLVIQAEKLLSADDDRLEMMEVRLYTLPRQNVSLDEELGSLNSCNTPHCIEVLSEMDQHVYRACTDSTTRRGTIEPSGCIFASLPGRVPIALASFPGSGNTWVRGLLQQVTGLCTGSLYCDRDLRSRGFAGEGVVSGSVLVVKTHKPKPLTLSNGNVSLGSKAILVIRNPFDALISERNRQVLQQMKRRTRNGYLNSSHLQLAGKQYFGNNRTWAQFVSQKLKLWQSMIHYWVIERGKMHYPSLVVKYENLLSNTAGEVAKMLSYLDLKISKENIKVLLKDGYSSFKRPQHDNFSHFTPQQTAEVNQHIRETQQSLLEETYDKLHHHQVFVNSYLKL